MHKPRILAIDLRSQRFGFAVLEGHTRLLDSGVKIFSASKGRGDILQKRIHPLLALYLPAAVVVNLGSDAGRSSRVRSAKLLDVIRAEVEVQSAEFIVLTRPDIRRAFRQSGNRSKDEIAVFVAESFPDIGWKLPRRRKNWEKEHYDMTVFDAISVGLTYLTQLGYSLPSNPEHPQSRSPG